MSDGRKCLKGSVNGLSQPDPSDSQITLESEVAAGFSVVEPTAFSLQHFAFAQFNLAICTAFCTGRLKYITCYLLALQLPPTLKFLVLYSYSILLHY